MNEALITVTVTKKTIEADGICSFELVDSQRAALPVFEAGAHIDVHIREGLSRQYSLCGDPRERHRYRIAVLRDANSRGGSVAMHEQVNEGDLIRISAPKNHFALDGSASRSLLLAGGIGVTPIFAMAQTLLQQGTEFTMAYCTRSRARTAFYDQILASAFAQRVSFYFDEGPRMGRLDIAGALDAVGPATHIYVCGPQGYIDAVVRTAREKGWPDSHIHFEYFGAAAAVPSSANDGSFEVKIASSGRVYTIPEDKTVVAALAEHGIAIPVSCEQGVCGTCVTAVVSGTPDHRDLYLTDAEHERNDQFTPCCSRAKSPMLVLDL